MNDCEHIKKLIEKYSGLDNLAKSTKEREYADYRFVYFALVDLLSKKPSLKEIASYVGLKNHTTVLHGIKKFNELKGFKDFSDKTECYNKIKDKHMSENNSVTVFSLEPKKDFICESVRKDILKRSSKGQMEYGITMDRNDLTELEWLQHLYEEQLDSCIYLKKLITVKTIK